MRIFRYIYSGAVALTVSAAAFAQHLDPTVNVTADYDAKLLEVEKPAMQVNVPDSVTRFDLDFGYKVLDSQFKGAYEFTPYELDMRPKPDSYREGQLWLRVGAGYSLHPTLDLIWSPRMRNNFRMSVYAQHDSYYGRYSSLGGLLDGSVAVKDKSDKARKYAAWHCDRGSDGKRITSTDYDLFTRAGVNGRYDWDFGSFSFDAAYLGIATDDNLMYGFAHHYDAADIKARARSVRDDYNYLLYDVQLGIRYGQDNMNGYNGSFLTGFGGAVNEFQMNLDARLGPVLRHNHGVFVDVDMNIMSYGNSLQTHAGNMAFTPKYAYKTERMNLEAGLRIDFMIRPKDIPNAITGNVLYQYRGQFVYPDVRFDYALFPDWLDVYARLGGGNRPDSYSGLMERNHNYSAAFNAPDHCILENTNESISTIVGLRGNVKRRFHWDLGGGWLYNGSAPLEAVYGNLPVLWYTNYHCAFVSLKSGYKSDRLDVEGYLDYKWTNVYSNAMKQKTDANGNLLVPDGVVEPARFMGGFKAEYNWRNRIYAGISCEAASNRRMFQKGLTIDSVDYSDVKVLIPWYCDLGLNFQYKFNPMLSIWAEAGNLLHQSIQRNVGFAEYGSNFTVGICLNL